MIHKNPKITGFYLTFPINQAPIIENRITLPHGEYEVVSVSSILKAQEITLNNGQVASVDASTVLVQYEPILTKEEEEYVNKICKKNFLQRLINFLNPFYEEPEYPGIIVKRLERHS
jgi:hypothetical protein